MNWREHLGEQLARLNQDVLAWESLSEVRAALEDRIRSLSGPEAVIYAALAWLVAGLDDYQRSFDEELAKRHGASWQEERKRIWAAIGPSLVDLEAAVARGADADSLLGLTGVLVQRWMRMRVEKRPRP